MRGKPAGAHVTLTLRENLWPRGDRPRDGEFMVTEAGSGYLVIEHRGSRFECVKVEPADIPDDAIVWGMYWVPRGRRR